jgi:POT family proton-dependent oligopeptide transporter
MATTTATARKDTAFLGHPVGLAWLSGSEFWERFSYYGMQALLVLYASHYLLQPGHVDHVIGFQWLKKFIEFQYGANLSPQAMAIGIAGQYAALVYVTPLAGGILADRFIGRTNTVTLGALLMALGQFMMALDQTFLIAILCMLVGVGCFKGNIASQVGDLYSQDDPRRADAFQIYFLGIQISVIIAPIICSTLGERVDWRLGFAAAGVGMLIGLVVYMFGRPTFPPEPLRKTRGQNAPQRPPLTWEDWKVVIILVVLLPILALSLLSNQEIFAAYLIWAEKNYQIVFFGETMPIGWMLSVDAGISMVLMVGVIAFWRWWGKRWREPTELGKIIIGTAISACAPLVLALASLQVAATGHPVSLAWAVAFHVVNDLGFSNVLPVGLALYSRAAPKGLGGIMIAVYYLHLYMGNALIGKIGGLLGTMPNVRFWILHSAIMAGGLVLLIIVRVLFGHLLAPTFAAPKEAKA